MREVGICHGIENYSRHLTVLRPGVTAVLLIGLFSKGFSVFIDESHVTIPQIRAMYEGDQARKEMLVDHGFRLPSCMDNRPLRFEEFTEMWDKVVFVSATPAPYELKK